MGFEEKFSFKARSNEAQRIRLKYPDRIPIIAEVDKKCQLNQLDKCKFLIPKGLSIGQFVGVIREQTSLLPAQAIFLFVNNNVLPPTSSLISSVYEKHKNKDGFLYITVTSENTFGRVNTSYMDV